MTKTEKGQLYQRAPSCCVEQNDVDQLVNKDIVLFYFPVYDCYTILSFVWALWGHLQRTKWETVPSPEGKWKWDNKSLRVKNHTKM